MRFGPLIAVVFAFFLIAIYPYYAEDDDPPMFIISDDDGDGVTNDKDQCPEEDASERDIDEDGCIDSEITKEEVDYIEKIAKFNLGQYILFAVLSLLGTAIYWEREKLRAVLYEDDDLDFSKLTEQEKSGDIEEDIDYAELGKDKEYNIQTESSRSSFSFSFRKLSEESDLGTQIICVAYIVLLFAALGYVGEFSWFDVEGTQNTNDSNEFDFKAKHYSEHLEYREFTLYQGRESLLELGESHLSYESSRCTDEVDKFYNCDYRQSLFGTVNSLLSISLFLGFFAILLAFRAQKYRIWLASVFSITLITSMASLLIFTSLIDNALIADSHTLDENQEIAGGCWMSNPAIWGETECVSLEGEGEYNYETDISYSPGTNFYIVLISTSIMFVGLFTHIVPMITMEQITWTEAVKRNWQVFAVIFLILFLWRLNVLMTSL
uniref:Uncharacterized protein n=1 Tax=uncultured marine group II/III euryarchaeote AD1000_85_G06 TaxID=1457815 RepID=A0A075FZQ0_9EURY|nr:hypothetical protein [uncultured marine group II/III euryarchaeote AD1000_85_G06]